MFTAEDLKAIREERKMTQQAIADAVGVTREMWSKMESGIKAISKSTQVLLRNYLAHHSVNEGTNTPIAEEPVTPYGHNWKDKYYSLLEDQNKTLKEDRAILHETTKAAIQAANAATEAVMKLATVDSLKENLRDESAKRQALQDVLVDYLAPLVKKLPEAVESEIHIAWGGPGASQKSGTRNDADMKSTERV